MAMKHTNIPFNQLTKEHPQLTEKALIDFVNGIEVIDDHIRFRETINQGFAGRLWNDLTGQSHLRQQTIDQHVNESLKTVSSFLQQLKQQQFQSDLAYSTVAEKLAETRAGVMRLNAKHKELAQQVNTLMSEFERLDNQYTALSQKVQQVDNGRLAYQQLGAVFVKWQAGRLNHYPVIIRLYLVFDELYWGHFGNYCRQYDLEREIADLIQQAKDKAITQLKQDLQINDTNVWNWHEQLTAEIQNLPVDYQQVLAYLTDDAQIDETPMLWAVNQLAIGNKSLDNCKNLPIVLNVNNAVQRFANDFGVKNAQHRK
jgi:hypothetical protein